MPLTRTSLEHQVMAALRRACEEERMDVAENSFRHLKLSTRPSDAAEKPRLKGGNLGSFRSWFRWLGAAENVNVCAFPHLSRRERMIT